MVKKLIIVIGLINTIGLLNQTHAQDKTSFVNKNTIYGSVGSPLVLVTATINYERLLIANENNVGNKYYLHVGYGRYNAWEAAGRTVVFSLQWLGGRKNSHLELGGGIVSIFDTEGYDLAERNDNLGSGTELKKSDYRNFLPAGTLGYRYQKPGGSFVFRTGIASPEGVYVSFGFAF